ncbi:NKAP-like protein [Trichoplax sp. H2]|nr:NKAP-like protein [Trichoplax sp. H2]|eukprot:RDD46069.1 NKAP-like protein [Trichoplax sp. H2]
MATHRRSRSPGDRDRYDRNDNDGRSRKHGLDDMFLQTRREERCRISEMGVTGVWGNSPKEPINNSEDEDDEMQVAKTNESFTNGKRKNHKGHHKSKKKSKKHKKSRERRKKHSGSDATEPDGSPSDGESDEELWIEKDNTDSKNAFIGPTPLVQVAPSSGPVNYGGALLPGEGEAMAQFVAAGKRIPRRGEIGLTSNEIANYETSGYVMSGSRHRRMEAVRLRKENQIYSADEKMALASFNYEERSKRENDILKGFRQLVHAKSKSK